LAKVLLSSKDYNCVDEMNTIVVSIFFLLNFKALLSVPSIFVRPKDMQTQADDAKM
jgi:hypothetical protein